MFEAIIVGLIIAAVILAGYVLAFEIEHRKYKW